MKHRHQPVYVYQCVNPVKPHEVHLHFDQLPGHCPNCNAGLRWKRNLDTAPQGRMEANESN